MPNDMPEDDADENADDKHTELLTHPSYQEVLKKLDEAEQKANQNWERVMRMQADSENALRRSERDIENAHKYALEKFVLELLPIVDSLELCIANVPNKMDKAGNAVIEGVNMTLKMFYTAMEKFGVKQINPVSQPFDPEYQQAISMLIDLDAKPGTVLSVLQKGYTLNNRLVRPALVVVAKDRD
jgi:molecular chaperone GrpE